MVGCCIDNPGLTVLNGAPADSTFIVATASGFLPNALVLAATANLGLSEVGGLATLGTNLGTAATKAASDNTKSTLASVSGTITAGHLAVFGDTNGTIIDGGSPGGGAVSSVSNIDGTLTISPTTGDIVASLNLGHVNIWTALQTFNQVNISGNISAPAWTTAGIGLYTTASTYTDTTSSGTVALVGVHALAAPTLAASSATTYTDAATWLINAAPVGGANATVTRGWGLRCLPGVFLGDSGGTAGVGATNALNVYRLNSTNTAPQTISSIFEYNGSTTITVQNTAITAFYLISTGSTGNITTTAGGGAAAQRCRWLHQGTGTVTLATGLSASLTSSNAAGSPITNSACFHAEAVSLTAATTWGTHAGLWVRGGSVLGTITTRYGVRIEDLVGGATRYGISQEGASDINAFAGVTTFSNIVNINAGTLASTAKALSITATTPDITGLQSGVDISITGSGTLATTTTGLNVSLLAGYTGSSNTSAMTFSNFSAGTNNDFYGGNDNSGVSGIARGTTTGDNLGLFGSARGGNRNAGVYGRCIVPKNSAANIGVVGAARNTGTSPIQIGGYFSLQDTTPTFVSAALIADNGIETSPIFLARDNGTVVFSIADGGQATMSISPIFSTMTVGSVLFAGTAGLLSQNNTNFFWDAANNRLGLGTNTPSGLFSCGTSFGKKWILYDTGNVNTSAGFGIQSNLFEWAGGVNTVDYTIGYGTSGALTRLVTVIGSTGNVGIGTISPGSPLTVISSTPSGTDGSILGIRNTSASLQSGNTIQTLTSQDGNIAFLYQRNGANALGGFTASNGFSVDIYGGSNSIGVFKNSGDVALGGTITSATTYAGAKVFINGTSGNVGIGTVSPDRLLHPELADAATNTISYPLRVTHITSGTATTSFGVGMEFEAQNASGTNRVVSTIELPFTDAVDATEDTSFILKLIKAGTLTQAMSVDSTGILTAASSVLATGSLQAGAGNSMVFAGRVRLQSPADGILNILKNDTTAGVGIKFGVTSSDLYLKKNGTALNVRLGDDSADAPITAAAITASGLINVAQYTTVGAPAYVKGAMYFDTTLNKLRIGGASAWETVTSV